MLHEEQDEIVSSPNQKRRRLVVSTFGCFYWLCYINV